MSKDTGSAPLVQHLKARKIFAGRVKDVTEIHLVKTVNAKTTDGKVNAILADLQRRGASKPRGVKTLTSTIAAIFGKKLSTQE